jgi:elongator complex protein 4
MISWPLALYPRASPLTRWLERLSDGVISLEPFPHNFSADAEDPKSKDDETLQGLLQVRKLPLLSERGMGVGKTDDLAFAVGRRRFVIRPFSLPPVEGEPDKSAEETAAAKKDLEF